MRIWLVGFAAWTALAVLSILQVAVALWSMDRPVEWSILVPRSLVDWYTCAVFTPAYFWMVRRWPLHRRDAARTVAIYAGITAVIVVVRFALYVPLMNIVDTRTATMSGALTGSFIRENIAFWCLLAVVLSIEYFRTMREREMQASRLQVQLAEARLDALSAQLHPHFLFNTIQGISTLIYRDPAAADLMLARLSTMLRHTLQRDAGHEVPLSQELELLELYLGIVRARFEDRLTIEIDAAPDTHDILVPRFLLQPLVENALQHGIARRAGAGRIDITARVDAETLVITVGDDGAGDSNGSLQREGIGLGNTRDRLAQLYGDAHYLTTSTGTQGGFVVTVRIPAVTAQALS